MIGSKGLLSADQAHLFAGIIGKGEDQSASNERGQNEEVQRQTRVALQGTEYSYSTIQVWGNTKLLEHTP